jgi:hypothetical protein
MLHTKSSDESDGICAISSHCLRETVFGTQPAEPILVLPSKHKEAQQFTGHTQQDSLELDALLKSEQNSTFAGA